MVRPVRLHSIEGWPQEFVSVSADGRRVMAGGADGRITVWDLERRTTHSLTVGGGQLMWAALSSDGRSLITSSADRGLRIWSVENRSVQRLLRLAAIGSTVAVTPDLSRAVTGAADGAVAVWDLRTGDRLGRVDHPKPINAVAIDPTGKWSAAGSEDGTASLWNAREGARRTLQHWRTVYDVLFWPAQRMLLTGSAAGDVQFWPVDAPTAPEYRLEPEGGSIVTRVAVSGDGKLLATLSLANSVQVWNLGARTRVTKLHESPTLLEMALSDNGARVLTAGHDDEARLWDVRSGKELTSWKLDGGPRQVALSRFADVAVVGTTRGAQVWQLANPTRMPVLRHGAAVTRIRFSGDGGTLATLSEKVISAWSIETGAQLTSISHPSGMSDLAIDENGTRIVVAGESGTGAVYSVPDGRRLCELRTSDVQGAAGISPDGRLAVIGSWNGDLVFCETSTGRETARLKGDSAVKAIAITASDDDASLLVGRGNGAIERCHSATGCRVVMQQEGPIRRIASSAAMDVIASTAPDATLRLWDPGTRALSVALTQLGFNTDLALNRVGDLVAASSDRGAQIWRTQSGQEVWRLERLGAVDSVALSSAGNRIAVAISNEVRVLGIRPEELITEGCRQTTRDLSREEWQKLLPGVRYRRVCPEVP
ncbi:MAG: WD40 repeat domain-containing protein [Acidobacteria bacterium]|nr:WD40 repeat domain-containing protein [Acidobacteriota bacterium]